MPIQADCTIVSFLRRQTSRIILVDYLNMRALSHGQYASMADFCDYLIMMYDSTPAIIVTKMETANGDDHAAITRVRPNILVIVCGTQPRIKTKAAPVTPEDCLAEADDHMISQLVLALTMVGCSPAIFSRDKYRNSGFIQANIPEYEYTAYCGGESTSGIISPGPAWTDALIINLIPYAKLCRNFVQADCKLCNTPNIHACAECLVCTICRMRLMVAGAVLTENAMRLLFEQEMGHAAR